MSTSSVPKALYQANIDLALRIAALLQEHGQQWFDLFADEAGVRLKQGLTGMDRFRRDFSIDTLPQMPVDFSDHFNALDAERWQSLLAKAIEHQSHFSAGVQSALDDWQGACSQLLGEALPQGVSPSLARAAAAVPGLGEMFSSLQQMVVKAGRGAVPTAAAPDADTHARKAAKPAAVKPAAAAKDRAVKAPSKPVEKVPLKPSAKALPKPAKKSAEKAAKKPDARPADAPKAGPTAPGKSAAKGSAARFPSPVPALVTTPRRRKKS